MPIDKSRLDRMITMIDDWMKQRVDAAEYDIENPVEAPPNALPVPRQAPFSDSPPQQIHGQPPKRDLFG
jgi:hypothetical protein